MSSKRKREPSPDSDCGRERKFETMGTSDLGGIPVGSAGVYTSMPSDLTLQPALSSELPHAIPGNPSTSAPTPSTEECVPIAAVVALDIRPEDEAVNGLLREPNPPKEVVNITNQGAPVPPLPMDLMELLVGE